MFESLKGMAGLAGLMKDLPRIKAKFEEVKAQLGQTTVDAETGGGAVRATANGLLQIVSIHVDQALLAGLVDPANPDDRPIAEDLITGAVNAALAKARELAEREMAAAASELGLPLPPGGLGGLIT
ncbi:MAG: YbaB/EbfC family nucleoid-associated protein [Planctomycetota bacterium]|jgi:DNA-binding protein YbaB